MKKPNPRDPWAAAQPPGTKVAPVKRDYIGDAVAVVGAPVGTSVTQNQTLLAAVIIAQALDRASSRLLDAAAINISKRS